MPVSRTFTDGDDVFSVDSDDSYLLDFLAGTDRLTTLRGSTTAAMGDGDDLVLVRGGTVDVDGDGGNDRFNLYADLSGLRLDGGSGNDRFNFYAASSGVDLQGGSGNDSVFGYAQSISGVIHGGDGDDGFYNFGRIDGRSVTLYGDLGNDVYRLEPRAPAAIVELADQGTDLVQIAPGASYTLGANLEYLSVVDFAGGAGTPVLRGNELANAITGGTLAETLYGMDGNDTLRGGGGDDTLWGVNGDDSLDGGDGNDILHGQAGNDILQGRAGNDVMIGGIGDDVYFVDSREDVVVESDGGGVDTVRSTAQLFYLPGFVENGIAIGTGRVDIVGNALDNRLVGTDVTNILEGGDGDDTLYGNGGMDRLEGGLGNDVLYGGTGFDQMYGGAGDDILIGGPGANQYRGDSGIDFLIFLTADGLDDPSFIIFNSQEDWLDLSRIDADLTQDGDQAFHLVSALTGQPGELWIDPTLQDWVDEFGDVVMENYYQNIYGDVDGDGIPDLFIRSELPETFPVLPDAIIL